MASWLKVLLARTEAEPLWYLNLWREDVVLRAPQQQAGLAAVCRRHPFDLGDDRTLNGFVHLLVAFLDDEDPPAGNRHVTAPHFRNRGRVSQTGQVYILTQSFQNVEQRLFHTLTEQFSPCVKRPHLNMFAGLSDDLVFAAKFPSWHASNIHKEVDIAELFLHKQQH